jgi:hypothetical protein
MWSALSDERSGLSFTMYNVQYINILHVMTAASPFKPVILRILLLYLGENRIQNTTFNNSRYPVFNRCRVKS